MGLDWTAEVTRRGWLRLLGWALFLAVIVTLARPSLPSRAGEPLRGIASTYPQTAGFEGQATVALPSSMGGGYDGTIYAYVHVCADRCAVLPAVDWCLCHVEPSPHPDRIVDLSHAAWALVTDAPHGLIEVTVERLSPKRLPDTALHPLDVGFMAYMGALVLLMAAALLPERRP